MFKNNSSQVSALIAPVHGCRDALRRQGKEPKDHHKDNLAYIKSLKSIKKEPKPKVVRHNSASMPGKDFIKSNISYVNSLKPQRPEENSETSTIEHPLGQVPEYLQTIKDYLKDTQDAQQYENSKKLWPAGTRLLPESERQERIEKLQREYLEASEKLNSLPFTSNTNATRARKSACEAQLKNIEAQLARLSLPKVFLSTRY